MTRRLAAGTLMGVMSAAAWFGAMGTVTLRASSTGSREAQEAVGVERGKYLVSALGCHDCHTPKKMGPQGPEEDMSRMLSGTPASEKVPPPPALPQGPWISVLTWDRTAWSGPWGVSYAINLTPDVDTGLGTWTEEMFVQAIKTGRHMGASRPILPPMPWQSYSHLTAEDLRSMFQYLRTIPAVSNRVPDPVFATPR